MLKRGLFVIGAALVLGGLFVASDASAARRGGHGARTHPVNRTHAVNRTHRFTSHNNTNYGANGPYVGMKYINH